MENKMGFSHKLAYSFFDFNAYKEFIRQGLGKSIFYIFLVTLIFSTIVNIITLNSFNSDISNMQSKFINEAPNFTLKDGELSIDSTKPIYYKHNGEVLIADTSGTTNSSVLDSYSNGIYVDAHSITFKQNYNTSQSINLKNVGNLFSDKDKTIEVISEFKIIFNIALLLFSPILSFLGNLLSVFILLGPITLFISSTMNFKLNYTKCCTLSFYAMTSSILIESFLNVARITISGFYTFHYIITLIYCALAINKLKDNDIDKQHVL